LTPLPPAQRIATLDVIRGVALCGILVMNMPGFASSFFAEADGSHLWPGAVDQFVEGLRNMLFSGKFNSMFSALFGIGFTLQFERMQRADPEHAELLYLRRLIVLGVFGLVHAMVFWTGDILHMYAAMGLLLLFALRRVSDRAIVWLIALCLSYPIVSGYLRLQLMSPETVAGLVAKAKSLELSNNAAYGGGSFLDAAREHTREFVSFFDSRWALWSEFSAWVQIGMTMLLGLLAGRRRWPQRIAELMPRIRRLQWWSLVLGIGCGALFTLIFETHRVPGPSPIKMLGNFAYWVSRLALMVFYVLTLVRLMQVPHWARRLAPFAAAGRMPLTNYLMQTALCTTLFYGWGFGLWNRVGPALGMVLALGIFFGIQVPWSIWWLARHEQGPLEWLWSRLTYGRSVRARSVPTVP
ncbi:MAG: DUF418 domain-containing protein, partial [Rhizobacter sp.]